MPGADDWSTHQLAEFLAVVSSFRDERSAVTGAIERAAEALEAEVGVAVVDGCVRAAVGFPSGDGAGAEVLGLGRHWQQQAIDLPSVGTGWAALAALDTPESWIVVARAGDEAFAPAELSLLRAMGRVLSQTVRTLREVAEREALLAVVTERERLLERLGRIQRSISHRAPLQEVLDGITLGAHDLLGAEVVGLRLIDPEKPTECYLASHHGIGENEVPGAHRILVGEGAGGAAIAQNRLVIIDDYTAATNAVPFFQEHRLTTAMAAPVHENGRPVGSLVVASYAPGRRYSPVEQEALVSLAQHASLALTDAQTVEAMREAQRAKDMFLAMVSHELKTPLTVIMGTLRTLETHGETLEPEVVREIVRSAYGRGAELERLIDRLLRGARAELAGARSDASLRDLVLGAVSGFAQLRRLAVEVLDDVMLSIDTAAFGDVLGILVENAVSHSPVDAHVFVTAVALDAEVRVTVSNPGELPDDIDPTTLFMPFHRGPGARSSGVGLGLYIAARLADSMDGMIEAASADGWVAFTLRLPRPRVDVTV